MMSAARADLMWDQALNKYEQATKKNLKDLPRPRSAEDLVREVQNANDQFKSFREKSGIVSKTLSALANPIEIVGAMAAGATSSTFSPSSMVFGALMHLINAAKGEAAVLDAITDLMAALQDFSVRLQVYHGADLSQELREKLTEILASLQTSYQSNHHYPG